MPRDATTAQARALRRRAPATERRLWTLLRDRRLAELKFRRQVPVGPYVLDFVCFQHRLVVEADGPFHDPERDARRDAWLAANGFQALRLPNREAYSPEAVTRILTAAGLL
jgi:very-short-patch-repair endonuclease